MAMDFRRFLNEMIGGNAPQVPAFQQQEQAPPPVMPQTAPVTGPMPVQGFQMPTATPVPQAPVQGPPQQAMSPAQFAAQQGPVQGPPIEVMTPPQPDMTGKWVTVQYQSNGVNYMLLMPEANAVDLPEGASLVAGGEVTDPERVARAYESGALGQQGQGFIGALDQAPPEVQAVFRSYEDQRDVDMDQVAQNAMQFDPILGPVDTRKYQPYQPDLSTTEVPITNLQGQSPEMVQQDQQAFDQMVQTVRPGEQGWETRSVIDSTPTLTTEQLRETDETKAAQLEAQGIFEVPADKMVVQNGQGELRVVPQNDIPPPNTTIVTYGGATPTPGRRGAGGLMSAVGDALGVLEIPQRGLQSLVADATMFYIDEMGAPGDSLLTGVISGTPGGTIGLGGFTTWIMENPDLAQQAKDNGYTAPNGETFTGNRAIWELYQSDRNVVERALDTTFSDPLNVVPSLGTPVRGAATAVGNVRRGLGYTDEVVDVVNGADNVVDVINPVRRTAEEILTTPATTVDDATLTAAEQAARNNPITGQGVIPDVVDVVPGQAVTPVGRTVAEIAQDFANAPRVVNQGDAIINRAAGYTDEAAPSELIPIRQTTPPTSVADAALGTTENILNLAADILDIPENALGVMVDRGIVTIKGIVDILGAIPAPDGRTIGDLWNRTTDQSVLRNTEEEVSTVFDDTRGLERRDPVVETPAGVVDEAAPTLDVRAPEFPDTPIPASSTTPISTERTGIGQQPLLATDRPIDDLGDVPAPVAATDAVLPTDRPIDDLTPRTPEQLAVTRDEEFLATPEGQRTQRILDSWDERYAFLRPQPAVQRNAGTGRLDEAFELRPSDIARELAPDNPAKYEGFVRDLDRSVKRNNGFIANEKARDASRKVDLSFKSGRFADQAESSNAVRDTWEVINEADHLINTELPLFNKHFGDVADAPDYQWKRWGRAGESHTALDTLSRNGGEVTGMPLPEVAELAIFHPDESTRLFAMDHLTDRLSIRDDAGRAVKTQNGDSVLRPELKNGPLKEILSRGRTKRRSLRNLRDSYQQAIDANRAMERVTPEPRPQPAQPVDAPATSTVTDLSSDGSIGGQIADMTEAATALDDIAMEARNVPLALPYRATSAIDATPMQGPRGTDTAPVGGNPVPASPLNRQRRFMDRVDNKMIENQVRTLADYRANAQRNLETTPLDRWERRSQTRREYLSGRAEGRAEAIKNSATPMSRMDLESFYVRGRPVSASQAEVFGRRFSDGESLASRWDRYTIEEMDKLGANADLDIAEGLAASRTINDYVVEIMPDEIRKRYDDFLKKSRSQKIEGDEGAMVNRSELMAQNHALEQIRRQPRTGRTAGFWRRYDKVMTAIRQTFLYNWLTGPRYITTQMVGNSTTAALTGHADVVSEIMSPQAIRQAWKASKNEGVLANSLMDEATEGYGLSGRRNITRGDSSVRDQTIEQAITETNKYSLLGRYTRPFADRQIRDMAAAFDRLPREAMWTSIMDTNLSVARNTLQERMLATLPDGASYAQARKLFDDLPQRFSSDDLRDTFSDFDATWVDRNARDWQEAITKTDKAAKAEVKRTFFDGTEKNIDTYMKRVLFFHYWMSRATPLYTEAIARDPVVLYNFMKVLEATRDDSDGSGANFLKFFSTPMGYNILIRPDAMLATFASFWEDAGFTPEGESKLGMILRNSPIMVNPLMQSALNLTGYMGDTFGPDPVGANKFIQFAQAAIDNANAQFGWGLPPVGNIQETTTRQVRDFVSGITGDFLPGAEHIEFSDPMAYKDNEVRSIVAEIALERGMDLEDPIVQDAMSNPSSEMYQEAMKRYALQDAMDIGLRILPVTAVLYPKSQLAGPKDRSSDISQEQQQSQQMGIGMTPRGDELYNDRDIIAASTEYSRTMQGLQDQYTNIGTPEEQAAYRFYNGIRFQDTDATIVVGGKMYSPGDLAAMESTEAESLADQWAEETGNTDRVESMSEQRKTFRDEHPEYQEYVSWSGQLRDYDGGVQGWWQDVAQGNPNAARWYNSLDEEAKTNDMILTSMDAFFAYNGEQKAYWDDTPIETRGSVPPEPYNPIGSTDSGTGSGSSSTSQSYGPTKQSIDDQIMEYQAETEAYNETVRTVLQQPPGFRLDLVNPTAQQAIQANLREWGIEPPRMGNQLYGYMQWAEANQGGDTSIDAYLRWYEVQNPPAPEETPVEEPAA